MENAAPLKQRKQLQILFYSFKQQDTQACKYDQEKSVDQSVRPDRKFVLRFFAQCKAAYYHLNAVLGPRGVKYVTITDWEANVGAEFRQSYDPTFTPRTTPLPLSHPESNL